MKLSVIPNFENFGVYVDDLDLENITESEWLQLRDELCSQYLLIIFRDTNLTKKTYSKRIGQWGSSSFGLRNVFRKYGLSIKDIPQVRKHINNLTELGISKEDSELVQYVYSTVVSEYSSPGTSVTRLMGTSTDDNKFLEGDLEWHQDESSDIAFCSYISLLGSENMTASATGFVTTAGWYQEQTESFKSELADMIVVHEFAEEKFNSSLSNLERMVIESSVGFDYELPLVVNSPGGFAGLHYPINSIKKIKGMNQSESNALFKLINDSVFDNSRIYDHWYQQDNDLLIFDNTISLHRRIGSTYKRVAYRIPFNVSTESIRYIQPDYAARYSEIQSTLFFN